MPKKYLGWGMYEEIDDELEHISAYRDFTLSAPELSALRKRHKAPQYTNVCGCDCRAVQYVRPNGWRVLRSYDTDVCAFTPDGMFVKLCNGWSRTTMKHVQGFAGRWVPKQFWNALEPFAQVDFETLCKGVM